MGALYPEGLSSVVIMLVHRSTAGDVWLTESLTPANLALDTVVRSPDGTYTGLGGRYDGQQAWWSEDGTSWTEAGDFTGGHPGVGLAVGEVAASSCP